jgi:hypothetical protein
MIGKTYFDTPLVLLYIFISHNYSYFFSRGTTIMFFRVSRSLRWRLRRNTVKLHKPCADYVTYSTRYRYKQCTHPIYLDPAAWFRRYSRERTKFTRCTWVRSTNNDCEGVCDRRIQYERVPPIRIHIHIRTRYAHRIIV